MSSYEKKKNFYTILKIFFLIYLKNIQQFITKKKRN